MQVFTLYDCCYAPSHNKFNEEFILELAKSSDVELVTWDNSFDHLSHIIRVIPRFYIKYQTNSQVFSRFIFILNTLICALYIVRYSRNSVNVFLTYDIVSIFIFQFIIPAKTVLFHHMQLDELSNPLKYKLFKSFSNNYHHIVMTEEFRSYLVSLGLKSEVISVIWHPLFSRGESIKLKAFSTNNCLALNHGIPNNYVLALANLKFSDKNFSLVIRSDLLLEHNSYIKTVSGFMPNNIYEDLINNSSLYLFFPPKGFNNRISGTIADAISKGLYVISLNCPAAKFYKNCFPNMISVIDNLSDLNSTLHNLNNFTPEELEIKKYFNSYLATYTSQISIFIKEVEGNV